MTDLFNGIAQWFTKFGQDFHINFIAEKRYLMILDGLGVTVLVTLGALVIGIFLGIIVALMRISKNRLFSKIASFYVTVIRGTPLLIQLLIIYYIVFAGVSVSQILVAILAFGINSGAYVGEIMRAGIMSIDRGQTEASRSLGLNHRQTMLYIVLPQAFKNILPALANEVIVLMKETSIVGYIALKDLTRAGDYIRSRTFNAYLPLFAVALIYLGMTMLLSAVFKRLERRLRSGDSH